MTDRAEIIAATEAEMGARRGQCHPEHTSIGRGIATRLGYPAGSEAESVPHRAGESWLFVRRIADIPPEVAARFDGVIVLIQSWRGSVTRNRDLGWLGDVRTAGVDVVLMDGMLHPGKWRPGLSNRVRFAYEVGASAYCLNVEPGSGRFKGGPEDWRRRHDECAAYATATRDLCDAKRLELWVSSWAKPPKSFPLRELVRPAHRAIPQPYRVHGKPGPKYERDVVRLYENAGARSIMLGRGAHELDKSDRDPWRTPAEIREHRATTLDGYAEVWWVPAKPIPPEVLDAMVEPR